MGWGVLVTNTNDNSDNPVSTHYHTTFRVFLKENSKVNHPPKQNEVLVRALGENECFAF